VKDFLKNLPGWHTRRKILVLAVDDYGNVRLDSRKAYGRLSKRFGEPASRFDRFDTMETTDDLLALYETLDSVRDRHGSPATFTPYAVTLNPDFERMGQSSFDRVYLEPLVDSWHKLASRDPDAWGDLADTWREGIERGFMQPQFHGGAHFNPQAIDRRLGDGDARLLAALDERSLAMLETKGQPGPGWTATFGTSEPDRERAMLSQLAREGLEAFQGAFGGSASCFTPPAHEFSPDLAGILDESKLETIDLPLVQHYRARNARMKKRLNWTGRRFGEALSTQVRNVIFEPGGSSSATDQALRQIDVAFRCRKPAIVSSHRVNFCGHIDPANRDRGLAALRNLLEEVVRRWPSVEFMGAGDLHAVMTGAAR
jgi:hypothetical protein